MSDRDGEMWSIRIIAAEDAQRRSRYAFIIVTIIAAAIAIAEFNSTWSWYTQFSSQDIFPQQPTRIEAQKALVQQWIRSNRMTVSLLGVDIGMSDAALLGSISLSIISLWFFFCIRRENHLIGKLLIDAKNESVTVKKTIFHGITGYLVFTTMSNDDDPISNLDQVPVDSRRFFLRRSVRILIYLPVITIGFIVFTDLMSLWMPSPIRDDTIPGKSLVEMIKEPRWLIQLALMEGAALVFGTATYSLCKNILKFEEATAQILRQFEDRYFPSTPTSVITPASPTPEGKPQTSRKGS
jgi:hypothetical protein